VISRYSWNRKMCALRVRHCAITCSSAVSLLIRQGSGIKCKVFIVQL
jgi:hypothetical protein